MNDIDAQLACSALGDAVVLAAQGRERMNALSAWDLRVAVREEVSPAALVGAPATLVLVDAAEGSERRIALLITEAAREIQSGGERLLSLHLSDPPWRLARRSGYRVFLGRTSEEVVTEVLRDAGFAASAVVQRISGAYPMRPQCVSYGEQEWAFIERLLAEDGISYWFDTTAEGEHRILLGDDLRSHDGLERGATLPYTGSRGALRPGARSFSSLAWEERVTHDRAELRDFDVRHPDAYLDGVAGAGDLVWCEYPAGVASADAAEARARRRLEQLQREAITVSGETDCVRVQPGRLLVIEDAGSALFEGEMVVTEVRHRFERPLARGGRSVPYGNHVSLCPTRDANGEARAPHRPPLPRRAALEHVDSAVITGPPGEEIHVDDLGRVKLRFPWDRSGITDDRSSHWARCLQLGLGASMMLPRVGWEVAVGYLDGSPDQPFVLGRAYNATAVTPYALPAAAATSALQTWTTPRSGMTQEIKMVDDAGREQLAVHAARDLTFSIGGSQTTKVGADEKRTVGLSLTTHVLGGQASNIAAAQTLDVGQELLLAVDGANDEAIAGAETIKVSGNRAVSARASCVELVGATHRLLCNQSNVRVTGDATRAVLGSKAIVAGLGVTEAVAGARTYVCRGLRVINCGGYTESITGGKRSHAGAVKETGVGISVTASSAVIKAGTATIQAAGKVSVTAPKITLDISGPLAAGPVQMSGGTLRVAGGGMTLVKGTTTRSRGGEVGS